MRTRTMTGVFTLLLLLFTLAACSSETSDNTNESTQGATEAVNGTKVEFSDTDLVSDWDSGSATAITLSGDSVSIEGNGALAEETTVNITEDEAEEAALAHAGLSEADVTFVNIRLDTDDGRRVYEVEFYSGDTEYDYNVDAETGEIVSYDYDLENYIISSGSSTARSTGEYIGEDAAKVIALAEVSGAAESNIRLYLDYDDGMAVYEGSIIYNELKYEFEINATDGTIIEWDVESVYDD